MSVPESCVGHREGSGDQPLARYTARPQSATYPRAHRRSRRWSGGGAATPI